MSSSIEPYDEGDRWVSYVSLLHPLLDFQLDLEDEAGHVLPQSIRELIAYGYIEAEGPLPPRPTSVPTTLCRTFGSPSIGAT